MSDEQLTNSQSIAETVPESVRLYLAQLQRHLALGGKVEDLQQLLELSFLRLSDRYFKFTSWPAPQHLELLVASTAPDIFPVIYSELYFRHIYARLTPTTQQRIDSWNNYLELFKWLESSIEKAPEQWTWDVIDEFVYQFQSFCVFRAKLKNKTTQDIELLKNSTQVWSSTQVISVLEKLSGLSRSLPLSLFATIGLVRVRCMLGEFESALKTLDGWDLSLVGRFVSVQLSLAFYVSFAYFILHRYSDAIRYLSNVLLLIARVDLRAKTYQYEQTVKKLEQLIALLAMSSALGNQPIDESLRLVLRDKFSDAKLGRLQRGEVSAFEELFCFASPKFVVVTPPPFDADPTINYTHVCSFISKFNFN